METLRPVEINEYYINRVASGMSKYFWDNIFKEIFDILKDNTIENSKDDVINALKSGRIWYEKGAFRGKFNNSISTTLESIGAKFRNGAYYIIKSAIPFEYVTVIDFVSMQALTKATRISDFLAGLGSVLSGINLKSYIGAAVDLMFRRLQLDIVKSAQEKKVPIIELGIVQPSVKIPKEKTKPIEDYWKEQEKEAVRLHKKWEKASDELNKAKKKKGITAKDYNDAVEKEEKAAKELAEFQAKKYQNAPQLDYKIDDIALDEKSKKIAKDYTYNMKYWVQKWEAKDIIRMRKEVLKMIQEGARVPRLEEYFHKRWKIAKDKAHFLAVNESHLAGSVIKATEYQELGCPGYVWGRSSAKEKRELHKHYYGQFFTWEDKPIIDEKLGIRGYPRQIWNCLCHMLIKPPSLEEIINKHTEVRNAKRNLFTKIKYTIKNSTQRNNNAWRYRRFGEGQTL